MPVLPVKVAQSTSDFRPLFLLVIKPLDRSNLTFGAGGKDSSGTTRAGWGYYEVGDPPVVIVFNLLLIIDLVRRSPAVPGPGLVGTVHPVYTPISQTRALEIPRFLNAGIPCFSTASRCETGPEGMVNTVEGMVWYESMSSCSRFRYPYLARWAFSSKRRSSG